MITFAEPIWLLAIPLALLAVWLWQRGRKPVLLYSDLSLVEGLPRGRAVWLPAASFTLRIVIPVLLIVAAAGPRTPDARTRLPVEGIAIAMAVDQSGSMAEPDYPTASGPVSRIAAAKAAFRLFVEGGEAIDGPKFTGRPDDLLAVIGFAAWPDTICPATLNRPVVLAALETLAPKTGPDAGTNIGDAIAESLIRLESTGPRRKAIVLLSDGEHNIAIDRRDPPLTPRQAAQLAADLGIPIYAIDCGGTPTGEADALRRRAEGRAVLESIARMTGGRAFMADDTDGLRNALSEIDQLERKPAESFVYRRYREWGWLLGFAAAMLLVGLFLVEAIAARVRPE